MACVQCVEIHIVITGLEVSNFKAWQNTGQIRFAPITVLFGTNSSGKSSIHQFLLMLKQTAESPDRRRVFHAGGEGTTPVALGSFRDFVFAHQTNREISFTLTWELPEQLVISDPKGRRTYAADLLSFHGRAGQGGDRRIQVVQVRELTYTPQSRDGSPVLSVSMRPVPGRNDEYDLETSESYKLVRSRGRTWHIPPPLRFYGFPPEAVARFQNSAFTTDLALELERELRLLTYLGPLRFPPARNYKWSGDAPEHVGWAGERTIEAVLAATGRRLNPGAHRRKEPFQALLARWLKTLGVIEEFAIVPVAEGSDVYEARVRAPGSSDTVLLPDVGFGVSQVLPVVVECFYAQPHATIIMEQPEIHLHPAVQSQLADLFIEAIRSRERGADRRVQLVVETHSEHLLRRLQRRIAEGTLTPSEVAMYFCETGPRGSTIQPLEVDDFGHIHNWPKDFFGDPIEDVARQAEMSLKRRAKPAGGRGRATA
jgi:predicted ATPase